MGVWQWGCCSGSEKWGNAAPASTHTTDNHNFLQNATRECLVSKFSRVGYAVALSDALVWDLKKTHTHKPLLNFAIHTTECVLAG